MSNSQLNIPNLKLCQKGPYRLEGTVFLQPWVGYVSQEMRRCNIKEGTDGHIPLVIGEMPEEQDEDIFVMPQQVVAYEYMVQEAKHVHDIILAHIFKYYNESEEIQGFREGMEHYEQIYGPSDKEMEPILPDITSSEQLKSLISLGCVRLYDADEWQSMVCYGFNSWDVAHGLSVLMLRDQVREIGITAGEL